MTPTLISQARATSRRRQEPTDWYTIGLGTLIAAGLPIQLLVRVATRSYRPGTFIGAPVAFVVEMVLIVLAGMITAAMAVGPMRASRAEYSCVLSAPLDRRRELRRRWVVNGVAGSAIGATVGVAAVVLSGADIDNVGGGAVLGAAMGAATMQTTTILQIASSPVRAGVQRGSALVGLGALVLMAFVVSPPGTAEPHGAVWLVAVTVGLAAAVGTSWLAWSTLEVLDRIALTSGNALATATSAAVIFLDPGLLGGVLAERRLARSRVTRSRRFPLGRRRALLAADIWRGARNHRAVVVLIAAMIVPYASGRVAPTAWVPVIALVVGVVAVSPFAVGFRQISASPVLRRMLGGTDAALRSIHLAVPAALALLFTVATAPAAPGHLAAVVCVPVGILLNLVIRSLGRSPEFSATIVDVGFGPIPVDLIRFIVRSLGPLLVVAFVQLNL